MEPTPLITIRNLYKVYRTPVLRNINLDVYAGETIGYIGPNGAGKSTTIKILIGMVADFEGEVTVLGYDVRRHPLEVKKRIGYVPENAALYDSLTPLEYLRFVGQLHQMDEEKITGKSRQLLSLFDLGDQQNTRMHTFSKGMRQKVLLIAGLIHNPDVLFLDEPLSGLDANAVILVKEVLAQLAATGKTIFYSSHLMDVVEKISNRIVILNGGEIVANGSFETLRAQRGDSLEKVFTELTGNHQHLATAAQFVQVLDQ
ncbi:MAG: ABC transporter ATP-binding protein [Ferruginibacter sp.]|nr:ABC transporter ATP-binding protein [Cytophagales bacterium]